LEAHVCDATAYPLPDSPLVVYMFNPFSGEVMAPVLDNIQRSLAAHPRDLFVAYYYPVHTSLLDAAAFLDRFASGRGYAIWHARRGATDPVTRSVES
jgi:hypothetical protein